MTTPASSLRRTLLLGGAAAAVARVVQAAPQPGPALQPWRPTRTPQLQATDLHTGQPRSLADFAGHALVVNFWATWCAPCRVELPSLNAAVDRLAPRGLRLLAVNHGEMPERVRRFLAEVPIHGSVLLDRSQTQLHAWGTRALPASFVFDARGRPHAMAIGELDWLAPPVTAVLEAATAA